ncbi:uncharacterized protein LOC108732827 [Agrilus planipennis]|uniref:Uncharacterized protein LOC108732827 n=1 Tax=Agrilus planipennis TaxID=224129 RepID=A0A1W4W5A6_AGRPL|nr:uncharacterized protein LOC108732827 [Agrilus planipennis]
MHIINYVLHFLHLLLSDHFNVRKPDVMGQCLKCFSIYPSSEEKMRERQVILYNQIFYLNDMLESLNDRNIRAEIKSLDFRSETAVKESEYQEQINALENRLQQQNVIMQQYQIYEKNYHNERQRITELQNELAGLKQQKNVI